MGAASGVLGRAACDEFGVVVLQQVFVEIHMFLLGQDRVVGFEPVFGKQSFIPARERKQIFGFSVKFR